MSFLSGSNMPFSPSTGLFRCRDWSSDRPAPAPPMAPIGMAPMPRGATPAPLAAGAVVAPAPAGPGALPPTPESAPPPSRGAFSAGAPPPSAPTAPPAAAPPPDTAPTPDVDDVEVSDLRGSSGVLGFASSSGRRPRSSGGCSFFGGANHGTVEYTSADSCCIVFMTSAACRCAARDSSNGPKTSPVSLFALPRSWLTNGLESPADIATVLPLPAFPPEDSGNGRGDGSG